ncbi:eukaryotic porin/Tom40 [Tricharina praecox]|uniref:eukaryotic porin/Tom40 n=1 Tax=Tricharina praecox TaxID=43433 RepID=UPI00221F41C8|nr:eukaryotic porin/Tom40 [Tricharina praecox]KAI5854928.1 eukaryotic porin/Tom40 [Tricharina praecox]
MSSTMADSNPLAFLSDNPISAALGSLQGSFRERRQALGLKNPGTVENVSREVLKDVFLNNHTFSGMRADLMKSFSMNPVFQISHAFTMGAQGMPPYTFAAVFGNDKTFMQATVDNDGQVGGRFNYRWLPGVISKTNVQLAPGSTPGQSVFTTDVDYTGADFSGSIKAFNPSLLDGALTGIFIGSYLQAITPRLSLGLESVWQRPAASHGPETALSYVARYVSDDWVASMQFQGQGALQATFYKKIADRVEAGVDCQLTFAGGMARGGGGGMMGGVRREGITTLGVKYDFRNSTFRAQVDSQGKLSCLLEKRVAPAVTLTFSADMDHGKNAAKVGLGVSVEAAPEDLMEMQERAAAAGEVPSTPSMPF